MIKVSVIIPTKNEERHILKVLDSLIAQDYPKEYMEILIVDAMSVDNTKKIVEEHQKKYSFIKLLNNPNEFTPYAFNIGIKNSSGDVIVLMGAHTTYSTNYVSTIVKYLSNGKADCVGSIARTLPGNNTITAKAIALGLSSPFGVGNSYMRIGSKNVRYVDTASCPGYKKEVFEKIGLFDEDLMKAQDCEFNFRLIKNGGKILLIPSITSYYYARDSLNKTWKMNFQYGYFKTLVAKKVGSVITWRQLIPPIFVACLIITGLLALLSKYFFLSFMFIVCLYTITNLFVSLFISIKKKEIKLIPFLIISFACMHFSYGFGYLKGLWDFIIFKRRERKRI